MSDYNYDKLIHRLVGYKVQENRFLNKNQVIVMGKNIVVENIYMIIFLRKLDSESISLAVDHAKDHLKQQLNMSFKKFLGNPCESQSV